MPNGEPWQQYQEVCRTSQSPKADDERRESSILRASCFHRRNLVHVSAETIRPGSRYPFHGDDNDLVFCRERWARSKYRQLQLSRTERIPWSIKYRDSATWILPPNSPVMLSPFNPDSSSQASQIYTPSGPPINRKRSQSSITALASRTALMNQCDRNVAVPGDFQFPLPSNSKSPFQFRTISSTRAPQQTPSDQ